MFFLLDYIHTHTHTKQFLYERTKQYYTLFYLTNGFVAMPIFSVRNMVSDLRILRLQVRVGLQLTRRTPVG